MGAWEKVGRERLVIFGDVRLFCLSEWEKKA